MKALFLYTGNYGSSRADQLIYIGVLPEGGDPLALIRQAYEVTTELGWMKGTEYLRLKHRETGEMISLLDKEKDDGETSYLILDLDKPGPFMSSFEHEGNHGIMAGRVALKRSDVDGTL